MHLLQSKSEGPHISLPVWVVDGQVFGECILLNPPLYRLDVLGCAEIARVPRLALVLFHQLLADQAITLVHRTAPVVAQAPLAIPGDAQRAVTLGAGVAGPQRLHGQ